MPSTQEDQLTKVLTRLGSLQKEIGYMKKAQADMIVKQDNYIKQQDEIMGHLENNDSIGKIGYIQKVDMLDERIDKVEGDIKQTIGKVTFAVTLFTLIGGAVAWAWSFFK